MIKIVESSENKLPSVLVYCLDKFNETGKTVKRGAWRISQGGYDEWYEIYYSDEPVIRCINGVVEAEQKDYTDLAYYVAEYYGDDFAG